MKLYRFSQKKYLDDFIAGRITFTHWRKFKDPSLTKAQQDNENERVLKLDPKRTDLVVNGKRIDGITDIARKYKSTIKDYYILCFTLEFDPKLYEEFKTNACLEILNFNLFIERLDSVLYEMGWEGRFKKVNYFNQQNKVLKFKDNLEIFFNKYSDYQDQKEFRGVIWDGKTIEPDRVTFEIGDLKDICVFK